MNTAFLDTRDHEVRSDLNLYLNFIAKSLVPTNNDADSFFRQFAPAILRTAERLRDRLGVPAGRLWRGVLLDPETVEPALRLAPLTRITYLSFSESIDVAREFARVDAGMGLFFLLHHPNYRGYLIEYTPQPREVLFSHTWSDFLKLFELGIPHLEACTVRRQQEVMLLQTGRAFDLRRMLSTQEAA